MPERLRLYDWRQTDGPTNLGLQVADARRAGSIASTAERRLISCKEAGDEGWWGTWAEMAFIMSQTQPYLTTPRAVARIEAVDVCDRPISLSNQFGEYLEFGNGRLPKLRGKCRWPLTAAFTRNCVPTMVDMTTPPQFLVAYPTDPSDIQAGKRVLFQGKDSTGATVYSLDNGQRVTGQFAQLESPFVASPMTFSTIDGLQKDQTNGPVQFWQMDPTTGAQILLVTMEPGELVANYRRYYFDQLPFNCCPTNSALITASSVPPVSQVTVTAIVKLEPMPLVADTDYFTLQGTGALEAITQEGFAMRYERMDTPSAKSMAKEHHQNAVGYLNGILNHYLGKDSPVVNFKPFGSARLTKRRVGMI